MLIELKGTENARVLDALVQRYFAMVYSTCLRITHNRHDAEDAAQAAFLCLARQLRDHKNIHAMGSWLHQVASNASIDICRRRKLRAVHEPRSAKHESVATVDDPSRQADLAETRPAVLDSLNALPTRYRLPLIMHYFGGMSQEQLAKELACTRNTLRVRLHRGHKMLRKVLEKRGICLAGGLLGIALTEAVRSQVSGRLIGATIALGRQVSDLGLCACNASPDVLAAAAQSAAPVAKTKVWIVISLAVASALTASAPLLARLRDLPRMPNPLDLLPLKLPEFTAPILRLSTADPLPPATPSNRVATPRTPVAAVDTHTVAAGPSAIAGRPAENAPFGSYPGQSSSATSTGPIAHASGSSGSITPHAMPDPILFAHVTQSREATPIIPGPIDDLSLRPASSRRNTSYAVSASPVHDIEPFASVAATFQPAIVSPWVSASTIGRGHGEDYIALAGENNTGGWLVYEAGAGGAVNALYAADFGAAPQLLLGQTSISDAVNSAITKTYTKKPATFSLVQPMQVLRNNGQVIADGRVEDYRWCNSIVNDLDNPHGGFNGWFAMNGGRVELPAIKIHRGIHTYNWGESASDTTIDLINSMRITANASGVCDLSISLLATDAASLPPFPDGHHFISVYEVSGGETIMGPMQTTVRYDDARLSFLALNENYIKLWYYTDATTGWQRAFDNFSRDTRNDWVTANIPAGVHYIAVSTPEPAAVISLLGTGALLLLRRSRQVRRA